MIDNNKINDLFAASGAEVSIIPVMTGDSFPTHAIRLVMLISAMTAIFAFLFKQKKSEEEEKNE